MGIELEMVPQAQGGGGWLQHLLRRAEGGEARPERATKRRPGLRRARRRGEGEGAGTGFGGGGGGPLTVAGFAAGAGLLVGAAFALSGRASTKAEDPEEIVARALCREDPDTPTHRGPLWTGYRGDARRVLAALREAGLLAPGG